MSIVLENSTFELPEIERAPRPQLFVLPEISWKITVSAFWTICGVLIFIGFAAQTMLQLQLSQGAFQEQQLIIDVRATKAQVDSLSAEVTSLGSPANLHRKANELGMVPMASAAFISVHDGAVFGRPEVAVAAPKPAAVTVAPIGVGAVDDGAVLVEPGVSP